MKKKNKKNKNKNKFILMSLKKQDNILISFTRLMIYVVHILFLVEFTTSCKLLLMKIFWIFF